MPAPVTEKSGRANGGADFREAFPDGEVDAAAIVISAIDLDGVARASSDLANPDKPWW